jgi:hypothetical protein
MRLRGSTQMFTFYFKDCFYKDEKNPKTNNVSQKSLLNM